MSDQSLGQSQPLVAPHLQPPPGLEPVDTVAGSDTSLMDGYVLEYKYTTGREYRLTFTADSVTFQMLSAPKFRPEFGVPVSLPYLARAIRDDQVLIHWMVPGRVGHVALVIDFATRTILVAALMPFKTEFFDSATISLVTRHGETIS